MPYLLCPDCRTWNLVDPKFSINDLVGVKSMHRIDINLLLREDFENIKHTAAVALIACVALPAEHQPSKQYSFRRMCAASPRHDSTTIDIYYRCGTDIISPHTRQVSVNYKAELRFFVTALPRVVGDDLESTATSISIAPA
jgi:hypothetical protein